MSGGDNRYTYCDSRVALAGALIPAETHSVSSKSLPLQRLTPAFFLAVLAYPAVFFLAGISPDARVALSDYVGTGAAIFAAGASTVAGMRRTPYSAGWRWIAVGLWLWVLGEVSWTWIELAQDSPPFPSIADAFYVPAYLALLNGILKLSQVATVWARARAVMDALLFAAAAAVPLWRHVLLPIFQSPAADVAQQTLSLYYPVADIILLIALGLLMARQFPSHRVSLYILAAGLGAMLAADAGFAIVSQSDTYQAGSIVDFLWYLGLLTLGVAAVAEAGAEARERQPPNLSVWQNLLPVVTLVPMAVWFVYVANTGQLDDGVTALLIGIYAFGLAARQIVAVLDFRAVHNDLEATHAQLSRLYEDLQVALEAESALARRDSLSGLLNRQGIIDDLDALIANGQPFALFMSDLDGLKTINDLRGHLAGDSVIKRFSALASELPATTVGRFGGDEFVLVTTQPHFEALERGLSLVRSRFEQDVAGQLEADCSISFGVARYPVDADNVADLLSIADARMYEEKRRRRIARLHPPPSVEPDKRLRLVPADSESNTSSEPPAGSSLHPAA